eukprot:TRINITY_DN23127_c0_g1_i2.p3 TRINITY_DN23127_c0_g1~~TRINITY_DN23127_c0_g1_i2.p3  ORF type:complete len:103 (+),score=2.81 TRINITY_DN23127_c0_g1_i2:134-442(+)
MWFVQIFSSGEVAVCHETCKLLFRTNNRRVLHCRPSHSPECSERVLTLRDLASPPAAKDTQHYIMLTTRIRAESTGLLELGLAHTGLAFHTIPDQRVRPTTF